MMLNSIGIPFQTQGIISRIVISWPRRSSVRMTTGRLRSPEYPGPKGRRLVEVKATVEQTKKVVIERTSNYDMT
jgi:hypothetical protein